MSSWKLDFENTYKPKERDFSLPNKLLASAGPTNCSPRVIAALTRNSTTPLCKEMFQMMDDIKELLKYIFQTKNQVTFAQQNAGTGGLESVLANLVDPGEKIIIAVGGFWGVRTVEKAKARNIDVVEIVSKPGEVFTLEELEREIIKHKPVLLFITHGESTGGTCQPLEGLGDICHKHNCLLAVDAIVSLGGVPFYTDRWGIDAAVAASQKALGAPAGFSYLSFSPKALERRNSIKTQPPFYWDVLKSCSMWNCLDPNAPRKYHYSYNSHMMSCVREALTEVAEEGLENAWERQRKTAERFWEGMEKVGLTSFVEKRENRLWTVTLVNIPPKVKGPVWVDYLEKRHQLVVGSGIGPSYGKALRVGIMSYNARPEVVDYVIKVLAEGVKYCLSDEGQKGSSSCPKIS